MYVQGIDVVATVGITKCQGLSWSKSELEKELESLLSVCCSALEAGTLLADGRTDAPRISRQLSSA